MAQATRYLRHRRGHAQRRVCAVTVASGFGAVALTVAFGAQLAVGQPASISPLPSGATQHPQSQPEHSAESTTHSHSAADAHSPAAFAPSPHGSEAPRNGGQPAASGDPSATHSHGG